MLRALCAVIAMVVSTSLWAGPADDLKAGLAAVQNGRHDEAIQLLTGALAGGQLSADDQVAAYKARGSEYVAKSLMADAFDRGEEATHLRDSATADFTAALRLKPDDAGLLGERGHSNYLNQKYDDAVADFDSAMRVKPSPLTLVQRASSHRAKGDYDRAIADYTAALGLDGKEAGLEPWEIINERALAAFIGGRYQDAATDFQKVLELGAASQTGDVLWMPYQVAWLHIARGRAGQNDGEELARNAAQLNLEQWPGTLVAFFLGRKKPDDVSAPTNHGSMGRARLCGMSFFIGEDALIKGDTAQAETRFNQAHAACNVHAITFMAANAELKRMKK